MIQSTTVALFTVLLFTQPGIVQSNHATPPDSSIPSIGLKQNITKEIEAIVTQITHWQEEAFNKPKKILPFVTLTFAQSLDGKIALSKNVLKDGEQTTSSNLPLSGAESLLMTHALRSIHDAILIGGNTFSTDNPRLTNRLWGVGTHQPRPVVLDTQLRHLQQLQKTKKAMNVIVCYSEETAATAYEIYENSPLTIELSPCRCNKNGSLDIMHVLHQLYDVYGIRSVMVEGGASVITAFACLNVVNCACITIAPKILGNKIGLAAFSDIEDERKQQNEKWMNLSDGSCRFIQLGLDCVFLSMCPIAIQ